MSWHGDVLRPHCAGGVWVHDAAPSRCYSPSKQHFCSFCYLFKPPLTPLFTWAYLDPPLFHFVENQFYIQNGGTHISTGNNFILGPLWVLERTLVRHPAPKPEVGSNTLGNRFSIMGVTLSLYFLTAAMEWFPWRCPRRWNASERFHCHHFIY